MNISWKIPEFYSAPLTVQGFYLSSEMSQHSQDGFGQKKSLMVNSDSLDFPLEALCNWYWREIYLLSTGWIAMKYYAPHT